MFSIATVNVNGLNINQKRRQVFNFFKNSKYDVICLQETHQKGAQRKKWEKEWIGKSRWCHGTDATTGVAILFRQHLDVRIISQEEDFGGRILRVTVEINSLKFQILTIYGPNPTTVSESEDFFEYIDQFSDQTVPCLLLGDFNMVQNLDLDRCGGNPRPLHTYGIQNLEKFLNDKNLCDIWRTLNPQKSRFTWHNFFYGIKSRLDRIYIPADWDTRVNKCRISPFSWSDHDIVEVKVLLPTPIIKGSGYYKFNTRLLDDPYFVAHIRDFFETLETKRGEFEDEHAYWDHAKAGFKRIAIWHSVKNARKKQTERERILTLIEDEHSKPVPNDDVIQQLRDTLTNIDVEAAKKVFAQTHAQHLEEGEKPTRYFFGLLKAREKSNQISELHVQEEDGSFRAVFDQAEIRGVAADYYQTLFTKDPNLDKDLQKWFLAHVKRKLSPKDRAQMEARLTRKELKTAAFQTENGKTPGWCGLPYEFYKFFWDMLEDRFYTMQDYCLNDICRFTDTQRKSVITLLYKEGKPQDLRNWRPISLLCCLLWSEHYQRQ